LSICKSLVATDDAFGASTVTTAPASDLGLVEVSLSADPAGSQAIAAIERLRDDHVPAAFQGVDAEVYVTGSTAANSTTRP
jgi:hypothetical protein